MTDLPDPLTPSNCDLRGYGYMPLVGQRLFQSRLYAKALRNPRAGLAAIKLWWSAWLECPAGSLPDDDDDLAMLADFGTDMKGWRAVREVALHGFIKCSDGRLYHPIVADEAIKAYEYRLKSDAKRESDRERLKNWREERKKRQLKRASDEGGNADGNAGETRFETPDANASETRVVAGRRKETLQEEGKLTLSNARATRVKPPAADMAIPDWIPTEAWNGWLDMRRRKRAPASPEAIRLSIRDLTKLRDQGHDVEMVLDQSTQRGWTGLFEPKTFGRNKPQSALADQYDNLTAQPSPTTGWWTQ